MNEQIINVPEIEPRLKHQTIFEVFDKTEPGQSFIIHNDHDPRPLYFQLVNMRGDIFTWEYLQQGPEWYDIRVTKVVNPAILTINNEITINVPEIEPRMKHESIFKVFNVAQPGESFVIHNDHDPKPVYYQLLGEYGDIFTWEYLQQGPEYWDVRVKKKKEELHATYANTAGDIVINIPMIEPRMKHATIFQTFEGLQEGKSLIIHNDHDPKPVYYQLISQYGETFKWEYLEQGPEWWDIRVTKVGADNGETVGEIAAKDLRKAEVFKKYGIDFCCGGKKTVKQVCEEKGIDANQVEKELQQTNQIVVQSNLNYNEWNLDFLADFIVNTHHQFVKKTLPDLVKYAAKVAQVHGPSHPELAPINELVLKVNDEMLSHMVEEENVLFPLVKRIFQAKQNNQSFESNPSENLENLVDKMEHEHDGVGRAMEEIRALSNNYVLPEDSCASYELLFRMLQEFENDLFTHIHLENNILFPKTLTILSEV